MEDVDAEDAASEADMDRSELLSLREGMRQIREAIGMPRAPWPDLIAHIRRMAER